jgi:hypothetical protein
LPFDSALYISFDPSWDPVKDLNYLSKK